MAKVALFPVLLAAGCVVAGVFGALHNQVSFTVSPEYFFAFKFHQFAVPDDLRSRIGAAIVGWYASWWMGLIIGPPVLLIGLILPNWKTYVTHSLAAFAVVALTALVAGCGALVLGYFTIEEGALSAYSYPEGVTDRAAFVRAGNMHNSSYIGGTMGIISGSVYLIVARLRLTRSLPPGQQMIPVVRTANLHAMAQPVSTLLFAVCALLPVLTCHACLMPFLRSAAERRWIDSWVHMVSLALTVVAAPAWLAVLGCCILWGRIAVSLPAAVAILALIFALNIVFDYAVWSISAGKFWPPDDFAMGAMALEAFVGAAIATIPPWLVLRTLGF